MVICSQARLPLIVNERIDFFLFTNVVSEGSVHPTGPMDFDTISW